MSKHRSIEASKHRSIEADDNFEFQVLPWPDYFGKAPKASATGRHICAAPLRVRDDLELNESIRGALGRERAGERLRSTLIGGRALVGRFLVALRGYPSMLFAHLAARDLASRS
ncbi:hypothetical protein ACIBED_09675 [Rhodococcus coprophilus]|uniref:hypothetical protein n=1 Tax=Rhodococcus coprophilus TaxID=38310 RepID=UPI0037A5F239